MRTTVRLNDSLFYQAKHFAAKRRISFTSLIEESIRERISRDKSRKRKRIIHLKKYRGNGLQPDVNLDNTVSLYNIMES